MQEDRIPFGVVLIAIGLIALLTITAVWIIQPALMPRPIYQMVVAPYLNTTNSTTLLPETPPLASEPEDQTFAQPDVIVETDATTPQLRIPSLDVAAPIEAVSLLPQRHNGQTYYQWQVPNSNAVGWHNRSAAIGQPGNTVFNGHHNIYGEVFRDLAELHEGDEIIVFDGQEEHSYQVTTHLILEERGQSLENRIANASWIDPTDDERLTLITCWPYTGNSHRVVVVAHPADS